MNGMDELRELPPGLLAALGALVAVQLILIVAALVVLVRTPADRVKLLPKPLWALVILLTNAIGPIVFLAAGRERSAPATTGTTRTTGHPTALLSRYGAPDAEPDPARYPDPVISSSRCASPTAITWSSTTSPSESPAVRCSGSSGRTGRARRRPCGS